MPRAIPDRNPMSHSEKPSAVPFFFNDVGFTLTAFDQGSRILNKLSSIKTLAPLRPPFEPISSRYRLWRRLYSSEADTDC